MKLRYFGRVSRHTKVKRNFEGKADTNMKIKTNVKAGGFSGKPRKTQETRLSLTKPFRGV
jgi:hypothetical protein